MAHGFGSCCFGGTGFRSRSRPFLPWRHSCCSYLKRSVTDIRACFNVRGFSLNTTRLELVKILLGRQKAGPTSSSVTRDFKLLSEKPPELGLVLIEQPSEVTMVVNLRIEQYSHTRLGHDYA